MLKSKIETLFEKHDNQRICQGDILRDIKFPLIDDDFKVYELTYPYVVVITQECDLNSYYKDDRENGFCNQFLPNIMLLPAFPAEKLRNGEHICSLYEIKQDKINSDRWKELKQNKNERYHFMGGKQDLQIPDMVLDFKLYLTISEKQLNRIYKEKYLCTVNELFRERLSQRFCSYLSRIGLPIIK